MRWKAGLSTGIGYRHPIAEVLPAIQEGGFTAIEIATAAQHLDLRHLERMGALGQRIRDLGLEVVSLHAPFGPSIDLTSADPQLRMRTLDQLTRAADALQMLGGGLYVIHPGSEEAHWIWDREANRARALDGLHEVWRICRERGLTFTLETALPHLLGGQPDDLEWLLARLPAEGTGVCLDTSHTSLGGFLHDAIRRFGPRLVHLQASDNRGVFDDHLPPGEGIIDWARVVASLEAADYRGTFLLEIAGDGDTAELVRGAARCLPRLSPR